MNGPGEARASQDGFSRPHHADPHRRRAEADREAPRREAGARGPPARRPEDLRDLLQGLHQRRLPVRIAAACATFCAAISPPASRTSPRSTRSIVPARSRAAWSTISSTASTAAKPIDLRSAGAEGDPRGDLRRHRLPGAGDADLQRARRLLAGRSRHPAPRHGQEEGRGDGEAARALHQGRAANAASRRRRSKRSST